MSPPLDTELSLFDKFKSSLDELLTMSKDKFVLDINQKYFFSKNQSEVLKYVEIFNEINQLAHDIRTTYWSMVQAISNCVDDLNDIVKSIHDLKTKVFPDVESLKNLLKSLRSDLSRLIAKLPDRRKFCKTYLTSETEMDARLSLDYFVEVGNKIIADPKFKGSNLDKLDRILADMNQMMVTEEFSSLLCGNELISKESFIALAAPSMEGKTQSAFTFRHVKPLYFPLSEAIDFELASSQPIYINYRSHAVELYECARLDLESISHKINHSDISATRLSQVHQEKKLWTVGFLMALVDDTVSPENWMKHYSSKYGFEFFKKKITEVPKNQFSGYCLFLDEFSRTARTVFIRNLARAIGLRCICSNTNTRVANIVGKSSASSNLGLNIWSLVIVRLNAPSMLFLNNYFGLEKSINYIKLVSGADSPLFRFLNDFLVHQFEYLRPGSAVFVAKTFSFFVDDLNAGKVAANLGAFLEFMLHQLYMDFSTRKHYITQTDLAFFARICLFYPESYSTANTDLAVKRFFNHNSYLEYHLGYLKNPKNQADWKFLTISPKKQTVDCSLRLVSGKSVFLDWAEEYTFFEKKEILTNMACIFVPFQKTPTALLLSAQKKASITSANAASNSPNLNALKLPSNPLEVSVAVSVCDASQHSFDNQKLSYRNFITGSICYVDERARSFKGQSGTVFIKNLVLNLNPDPEFRFCSENTIDVEFSNDLTFDLKVEFLDLCKIPFLYGIGHEIQIFKSLSSPGSDFYVESYERTPDAAQIDGKFSFLFNDQQSFGIVECKNWSKKLDADDIRKILVKTVEINSARLSLLFCRSCPDKPKTTSKLHAYCKTSLINVYRVKKMDSGNFSIGSYFSGKESIFISPKSICFIFESPRFETSTISRKFPIRELTTKLKKLTKIGSNKDDKAPAMNTTLTIDSDRAFFTLPKSENSLLKRMSKRFKKQDD